LKETTEIDVKLGTVLKIAALSGAALAGLAAAAYKNLIPGGPELVDGYEALKNRLRDLRFRHEAASVPAGTVVFLGSSTVAAFPLEVHFPGAPCLNRGLGAETLTDLIGRLDARLPVARPASVVIFAGMNDLRSEAADPPVIVARMERLIDTIRQRFPGMAIALIEPVPWCDQSDDSVRRLRALNDGLRELTQARDLAFVRTMRPPLVDDRDCLEPSMARPDRKHLGSGGYGVVAQWLIEDGGAAAAPLARPS
jgi:lysophospholipase L1-like esterase